MHSFKTDDCEVTIKTNQDGYVSEVIREYPDGHSTTEVFSYDMSRLGIFCETSSEIYENDKLIKEKFFGDTTGPFEVEDIKTSIENPDVKTAYDSTDSVIFYRENPDGQQIEFHCKDEYSNADKIVIHDGDITITREFGDHTYETIERKFDDKIFYLKETTDSGETIWEYHSDNTDDYLATTTESTVETLTMDTSPDGKDIPVSLETHTEIKDPYNQAGDVDKKIDTVTTFDNDGNIEGKTVITETKIDYCGEVDTEIKVIETYDADGNLIDRTESFNESGTADSDNVEFSTSTESVYHRNEDGSSFESKVETTLSVECGTLTDNKTVKTDTSTNPDGSSTVEVKTYTGETDIEYEYKDHPKSIESISYYEVDTNGNTIEVARDVFGSPDNDGDMIVKHYINVDGELVQNYADVANIEDYPVETEPTDIPVEDSDSLDGKSPCDLDPSDIWDTDVNLDTDNTEDMSPDSDFADVNKDGIDNSDDDDTDNEDNKDYYSTDSEYSFFDGFD